MNAQTRRSPAHPLAAAALCLAAGHAAAQYPPDAAPLTGFPTGSAYVGGPPGYVPGPMTGVQPAMKCRYTPLPSAPAKPSSMILAKMKKLATFEPDAMNAALGVGAPS